MIPPGSIGPRTTQTAFAVFRVFGHTISHLELENGSLWWEKEVKVPLSEGDYTAGDMVHLKLGREAMRELPAV